METKPESRIWQEPWQHNWIQAFRGQIQGSLCPKLFTLSCLVTFLSARRHFWDFTVIFALLQQHTEPRISQKHFITVNKDSNKNYNVYCHFKTTTILALLENIHLIMFLFFFNWSLLWFYIYLSNKKIKKTFIFIWFKVFVFICPSQGEGVLEQTDASFPLYETPVRWLDWQPQLITATDSF